MVGSHSSANALERSEERSTQSAPPKEGPSRNPRSRLFAHKTFFLTQYVSASHSSRKDATHAALVALWLLAWNAAAVALRACSVVAMLCLSPPIVHASFRSSSKLLPTVDASPRQYSTMRYFNFTGVLRCRTSACAHAWRRALRRCHAIRQGYAPSTRSALASPRGAAHQRSQRHHIYNVLGRASRCVRVLALSASRYTAA